MPEGFRAYEQSIQKPSLETPELLGRRDPFININHIRAKYKNDSDVDAVMPFRMHPLWTPIVPVMIIGAGIYIIVTGVIANPPGDDDDDD